MRVDGRMLVLARSPLFGHALSRMGTALGLDVLRVRGPAEAGPHWNSLDVCLAEVAYLAGLGGDRAVPVIAFSADPAAERSALEAGASGFLKVPCRQRDLAALVSRWVGMRRAGVPAASAAPAGPPDAPPAPLPAAAPEGRRCPTAPAQGVGEEGELVLLVDDSQVIHAFVEGTLRPLGYRVAHASDGQEGLEVALREKPDLVISDIDMPRLDGFEMCRQIKAHPEARDIPILILSARGAGVDIDRGFDVGANDFLTKPVSENELASRVAYVLRRGPAAAARETVLVVEDSAVQRGVIVQALAQQGFAVLAAENGRVGLDLAMRHSPDLVVTDSEMPVMNGRDLTRELKRLDRLRDVPVMMLTAADSELSRAKGRHAGVSAYLTKPFVPDKVVVIVEKLIAERRLLRERQAMQHYLSDSAAAAATRAAAAKGDVDDAMRAETRFVTILFADLVGFTPLTERLAPAELVRLLNAYFDAMTPLFREHGGVIDKLIGDAIMAVFAAAEGESDAEAAARAVATGLAMQETLARFNAGRAEPFQLRVGLDSGPVVMGDIGSRAYRRDYTVIGDHVNVAARLESAARPGTVLVSGATWELVRDRFAAERRGPIRVKGKSQEVTVYEVRDERERAAGA